MSQPLTILFLSATRDKSLAPPTAAKSCGQGQVHCAKCLEAGNLRNRALFLHSSCLGRCHTCCCSGAGGSCHSCFLLDASSSQCQLSSASHYCCRICTWGLSFKRLRKEQGSISSALCWAGLSWGWGLALRPLLCSRGGKGVFVIKPEGFP